MATNHPDVHEQDGELVVVDAISDSRSETYGNRVLANLV